MTFVHQTPTHLTAHLYDHQTEAFTTFISFIGNWEQLLQRFKTLHFGPNLRAFIWIRTGWINVSLVLGWKHKTVGLNIN